MFSVVYFFIFLCCLFGFLFYIYGAQVTPHPHKNVHITYVCIFSIYIRIRFIVLFSFFVLVFDLKSDGFDDNFFGFSTYMNILHLIWILLLSFTPRQKMFFFLLFVYVIRSGIQNVYIVAVYTENDEEKHCRANVATTITEKSFVLLLILCELCWKVATLTHSHSTPNKNYRTTFLHT